MPSFPSILLRIWALLPLPIAHVVGAVLGWAMYGLSPTYRRHLKENFGAAGYRDARTRRRAIAEAGKLITEIPRVWLHVRQAQIRGWDWVDTARRTGKGIVFLTPHLGCFEVCAKVAAQNFPITALYREPKQAWLRRLVEEHRAGGNLRLARADIGGVRELLAALKRGEAIGILPDHVPGEGEGEWAEFFSKPAFTMTLAARLVERAMSHEAFTCLLAWGERLPWGGGYVVHVQPAPAALPGESGVRRINRMVEELVSECPQQYLWGYNRYKKP
jgi:KDO2-lipid IV(A) lauroyltransferase